MGALANHGVCELPVRINGVGSRQLKCFECAASRFLLDTMAGHERGVCRSQDWVDGVGS